MTATTPAVKVGQIWKDNDWLVAGRQIRVDSIDETHAACTITANSDEVQAWINDPTTHPAWVKFRDMRGKTTRIKLDRFKPTTTGYRLITDVTP